MPRHDQPFEACYETAIINADYELRNYHWYYRQLGTPYHNAAMQIAGELNFLLYQRKVRDSKA
mgnify:FL=1